MIRREGTGLPVGFAALIAALAAASAGCNLYFGNGTTKDDSCESSSAGGGGGFEDDGAPFPSRPLDDLGPTVQPEDEPPPISGGTLALSSDGTTVVAADSDRDQVYVVSLITRTLAATVPLVQDDEPGRVALDDAGRAHVALRRGGGLATIDIASATVLARHPVCPAPRGLMFAPSEGTLYVSCHGGEVLVVSPDTGEVLQEARLEDVGLRDIVVDGDTVYVSVFRTAEVIALDRATLVPVERLRPPILERREFDFNTGQEVERRFEPAVAWRMKPDQNGGVVVLHQRGLEGEVKVSEGGYGGDPCGGGIVHAAITPMRVGSQPLATQALSGMVLPVDFAVVSDGFEAIVTAAGSSPSGFSFLPAVNRVPVGRGDTDGECFFAEGSFETFSWGGPPTAVVATQDGTVAVQMRDPARLLVFTDFDMWTPTAIDLSSASRRDTGHDIFHMDSGAGIACASCHPEGGDDARTWTFKCIGPRRTQSLQFGLLGTEPFHWDGDMDRLSTLMSEVFVGRMAGGQPRLDQIDAVGQWLDKLRPPPASLPLDQTAVERGQQIFNNPAVGCATCHSGGKLTNSLTFDVGTGGAFQVPSLIGIANRAPFMHSGCASTLAQRFADPECGGGDRHGVVSQLSPQDIADLIAYLETL